MLLALSVWQHMIQRLPMRYEASSWGAVFPLGMYTVATREMAVTLELPFLNSLLPAISILALIVWTPLALGCYENSAISRASAIFALPGHATGAAETSDECASFIVKDYEGKSLAYVYFEDEAGPAISGASAHPRRGASR